MIWLIQPLAAGTALRILLSPPPGADRWRLLRRDAADFSGEADPLAYVVHEGTDKAITDYKGLLNGAVVYYRLYSRVAGVWQASGVSVPATPGQVMEDLGVDVVQLLRDRIEEGFKPYVDRGDIKHDRSFIPVMKASPQVEEAPLPMVTVHLQNAAPEVRGIGEVSALDEFDDVANLWLSTEGGFDRVSVTIVCWSINSDLRIIMRKALRAILQANLPIFDAAGLVTPSWSMQDMEDYQTYQVPMFQTICSFDCLAPASIQFTTPPIVEAIPVPIAIEP